MYGIQSNIYCPRTGIDFNQGPSPNKPNPNFSRGDSRYEDKWETALINNNSSRLGDFCLDIEDSLISADATLELKIGGLLIGVMCFFITVGSFVYFLYNKEKYIMLKKRNTVLLSFVFISFLVTIVGSVHRILVGASNTSCRMVLIMFPIHFILFMEANLGRLFSLLWRIGFNQRLIDETYSAMIEGELVLGSGSQRFIKTTHSPKRKLNLYSQAFKEMPKVKPKSDRMVQLGKILFNVGVFLSPCIYLICCWKPSKDLPKTLQFSQFLSSWRASVLAAVYISVIFISLDLYDAFLFIPLGEEDCFGCPVEAAFIKAPIYLIAFTAAFYFYILFKLRKIPDSLGIKKELLVVGVILSLLNILVIGVLRNVAPEIEEEGKLDYSIIFMIGVTLISFYKFTYQVWLAKSEAKKHILDIDNMLLQVLKSREGKKAFALFLASTLSFETLLFYEIVQNWKEGYEDRSIEENKLTAQEIYDQFISAEAVTMINISGKSRTHVENDLNEEIVVDTLFDDASNEMFVLMANDVFPRFIKSTYYKAYKNEHQQLVQRRAIQLCEHMMYDI